ncbi:MAG: homocysteine S-methyltransferase family protein, partial [Chthoniobacterales bacterium]|nr:homocysteine S-methyltransferase family protein [Chthoniobacterales bacterium]
MDLLDELQTRLVCGDGAIGTLLLESGVPLERCFEELCVSDPERIRTIHDRYIAAGARVIETNTFGANAVRLERFGFESRVIEINRAAAQLACAAANGRDIAIAGSIGPLGITADEATSRGIDRAQCFRDQITGLLDGGAELLLFETFMDFDEMAIALAAKNAISDALALCSFACAPEGRLSTGMPVVEAFGKLREAGAGIVGLNCMNGPHGMVQLLERIPLDYPLAAYANAGYPKYHEGRFIYHTAPEYFAQAAREMVAQGVRLIGGCCGTNPTHIRAIADAIAQLQPVKSKTVRVIAEPLPVRAPTGER